MTYNYQKHSFTLVEVLVAVVIIVFIGVVLLKIVSNNTFFIGSVLHKSSFSSFISLFPNTNKDVKNKSFAIKDVVASKYPSLPEDLKSFLGDTKVEYSDQRIALKSILDSNISEVSRNDDSQDNTIDFKVEIRKKIITTSNKSDSNKNLEYLYYFVEHLK